MDAQKIKNPRSIAIAPKSSSLTLASAKPQQGTQIKSNPAVGRQHTAGSHLTHSQDQGPSQRREDSGSRILDVRNCDSQASPRDDPFIRSHPSSHLNRSAAESRIAQGLVKRNDDVCCPLSLSALVTSLPPVNSSDPSPMDHRSLLAYPEIRMLTV